MGLHQRYDHIEPWNNTIGQHSARFVRKTLPCSKVRLVVSSDGGGNLDMRDKHGCK